MLEHPLMKLATNKVTIILAAFVVWTAMVHKHAYNAGYDKADAECKEAIVAAQTANMETTQWKLDAQEKQYLQQIEQAREVAENERKRAIRLRQAIADIHAVDATDCTAIPVEWVQSVRQAFGDQAN